MDFDIKDRLIRVDITSKISNSLEALGDQHDGRTYKRKPGMNIFLGSFIKDEKFMQKILTQVCNCIGMQGNFDEYHIHIEL